MARLELRQLWTAPANGTASLGPLDLVVEDGSWAAVLAETEGVAASIAGTVGGFRPPEAGEILLDGDEVGGLDPAHRAVGYGFCPGFAYEDASVRRNLELAVGRRDPRVTDLVEEATLCFELNAWLDRPARELPTEVFVSVALCRALIRPSRSVVILEQPSDTLDVEARRQTWIRLGRWRARSRATVLVVTTDPIEALSLAETALVVSEGGPVQSGDPLGVLSAPDDVGLADRTGTLGINRMACTLEPDAIFIAGTDFGLAGVWLERAQEAGSAIELGIRPEHVEIRLDPHEAAVPATVIRQQPCPLGVACTARVGDQEVRALAPSAAPPLDEVHLYFPPERLLLFGDGRRLL